jgi:light-harvesting complex I chlorophyll a/b binding protein 1
MRNPTKAAFLVAGLARRHPLVTPQHQRIPAYFSSPQHLPDTYDDDDDEEGFLLEQLARIEAMEEAPEGADFGDYDEVDDFSDLFDEDLPEEEDDDFSDLFDDTLPEDEDFFDDDSPDDEDLLQVEKQLQQVPVKSAKDLENALLQGVVPAGAGVGSQCLPGDWGFDPLNLATKDTIGRVQRLIWGKPDVSFPNGRRPTALIFRDYREAEIRHGRLAMLASLFWPLQEMLDRLLLGETQFGSLLYGSVTLPYIPLLMTVFMMLLGYLDVYSQSIKSVDDIGEAFLPGDCFWDPLSVLDGAPDLTKRNMQERELFNGRMAMLAVAVYFWEELTTHQPLISVKGNELLFEPAYQVPFIQEWLDAQFSPVFIFTPDEAAGVLNAIGSLDL